jgi:O6-methylguanine-DNA--protein-cysteine methyltransferase
VAGLKSLSLQAKGVSTNAVRSKQKENSFFISIMVPCVRIIEFALKGGFSAEQTIAAAKRREPTTNKACSNAD